MPTRSTLWRGFSWPTAVCRLEKTPGSEVPSSELPASVEVIKPLRESDEFFMWNSRIFSGQADMIGIGQANIIRTSENKQVRAYPKRGLTLSGEAKNPLKSTRLQRVRPLFG